MVSAGSGGGKRGKAEERFAWRHQYVIGGTEGQLYRPSILS